MSAGDCVQARRSLTSPATPLCVGLTRDGDDVLMMVTGSSEAKYTGVGFGEAMADALILLLFPQPGGTVTASMRVSTGRSRPAATQVATVEVLRSSVQDNLFSAQVRCKGCGSKAVQSGGPQPMIWAQGRATTTEVGDQGVTSYHFPFARGKLPANMT
ncbi:hypothetical protein PYCC9005_001215 [Savitreella phatthalungensis]